MMRGTLYDNIFVYYSDQLGYRECRYRVVKIYKVFHYIMLYFLVMEPAPGQEVSLSSGPVPFGSALQSR